MAFPRRTLQCTVIYKCSGNRKVRESSKEQRSGITWSIQENTHISVKRKDAFLEQHPLVNCRAMEEFILNGLTNPLVNNWCGTFLNLFFLVANGSTRRVSMIYVIYNYFALTLQLGI